jgi:hypothetical protein
MRKGYFTAQLQIRLTDLLSSIDSEIACLKPARSLDRRRYGYRIAVDC